jgi:general secretion pathway protein J
LEKVRASMDRHRQCGFTLLEMLVALTVLGFLVIGLNEGIRTGFGIWSAHTRQIGGIAELDSTARLLRTLLGGIPLLPAAAANPRSLGLAISFSGAADQVAFVGDMPTGLGSRRRADIQLAVRSGRLVLLWKPHRHEQSNTVTHITETELLRDVAHVDFAYLASVGPNSTTTWVAQWNSPAIPQMIRIRLIFRRGDNRQWPDIIVSPQLSAPEM